MWPQLGISYFPYFIIINHRYNFLVLFFDVCSLDLNITCITIILILLIPLGYITQCYQCTKFVQRLTLLVLTESPPCNTYPAKTTLLYTRQWWGSVVNVSMQVLQEYSSIININHWMWQFPCWVRKLRGYSYTYRVCGYPGCK